MRFKIGRKSYRIDIRKVGIHENTFIFLKEKKIRNEFVRTLLMQDQGNLHDVHAPALKNRVKKKKGLRGEEKNMEEFKRWNIDEGESNDTTDCIREKLVRVVGTRIAGGTPPGEESILRYKFSLLIQSGQF